MKLNRLAFIFKLSHTIGADNDYRMFFGIESTLGQYPVMRKDTNPFYQHKVVTVVYSQRAFSSSWQQWFYFHLFVFY